MRKSYSFNHHRHTLVCPYCQTPTRENNNKVYCPTCNKSRKIVSGNPVWSLK